MIRRVHHPRRVVCTRQNMLAAVHKAQQWLDEGRSELAQFRKLYALENPQFIQQQYTGQNSIVAQHIDDLSNFFECSGPSATAIAHEARIWHTRLHGERRELARQVGQGFGEERMRAGMFGGLGALRARARRRRPNKPSCSRVWVRGYYR